MHKAINAKFNVGQLVKHKNGDTGVIEVVNPANGFGDYMVRIVAGHGGFGGKASWDEKDLSVANCATANSVVAKAVANARAANAAFKVGDRVKANPKFLEFCPPEMKGREWTVTSVYGLGLGDGGGFFDLKSGDKRLSGIPSVKCVSANSSAEPTVAKNAENKEFGNVTIEFLRDGSIGCRIRGIGPDPFGKKDVFIARAMSYISSLKNSAANLEKAIAYIKTR